MTANSRLAAHKRRLTRQLCTEERPIGFSSDEEGWLALILNCPRPRFGLKVPHLPPSSQSTRPPRSSLRCPAAHSQPPSKNASGIPSASTQPVCHSQTRQYIQDDRSGRPTGCTDRNRADPSSGPRRRGAPFIFDQPADDSALLMLWVVTGTSNSSQEELNHLVLIHMWHLNWA